MINNDFILLDVPNHRNIGDTLIWQGELIFFKNLKYKLLDQYNRNTFNNRKIKSDKDVIILHGGGNFGDIYHSSQGFKLDIINKFKNNRIVIMPQTVFYNDNKNLISDMKQMSQHKDLHICVRDQVSFDLLSKLFDVNRIYLLPDMAFFINLDEFISNNKKGKNLVLNRTDAESTSIDHKELPFTKIENEVVYSDWPTYNSKNKTINTMSNYVEAFEGKVTKVLKNVPGSSIIMDNAFGLKSTKNIDKYINSGITFLNEFDEIATTRLHGAILSILLNKKVFLFDNFYGKNKNYYNTWLKEYKNVILTTDN
ncbi:polysaccharide pyruvyl transferase family protein [Nonlabens xylanidelens]|uniref:polysaccharide pyruvyl transferase family protein n=1 Tax=Nonlabens xylanidelens TaxID=191564 RepID=UPI000CF37E26|nr:hypothetical protein BST94_05335 [Nonlabens xylanidelens]